jgi:hypothetical protein
MDKQQLSRQLHRLAQEEVPDTMNLWPRIQGQLKRKSKPRSFSFAYAMSALVMIMLVGIGGFVAYRSASVTSQEAVSPNQATPLSMSQTIGGVTMSLDWAYADAHLISLQYTVVYNPQEVSLPNFSIVNLRTADGQLIPLDNNGGGGGGGGGDGSSVSFSNQVNFDASVIQGNPESLNLVLLVQYTESVESYEIQFQPTVPPPAEGLNEPKDISTATPIVYGIVTALEPTNLRIGPATDYPLAATLPAGTRLQVLAQNGDGQWYNVRLDDGREGWVSSNLVQLEATATPLPYNGDAFSLTATSLVQTATATAMGQVAATDTPDFFQLTATSLVATATATYLAGFNDFSLTATEIIDAATISALMTNDPFSLTATSLVQTATATAMPPTVPPPNQIQVIEPSLIPPMQFTPTPVPANPLNLFAFSFSVPFYPAKTGEVTATNYGSNTIVASVENVSITPAMTKFDLCYTLPSGDSLWTPKIGLDTGFAPSLGNMSAAITRGLDGQSLYPAQALTSLASDDRRSCWQMISYAPFSPEANEMDIQLDYLYRPVDGTDPATWAADEAFFKERGFDLSYAYVPLVAGAEQEFYNEPRPSNVIVYPIPESGALLITLRDYPDSFAEEWEAINYIYDHMLKERVDGHWNFHVTVE